MGGELQRLHPGLRAYPDPRRPYFTLRDVKRTLGTVHSTGGREGAIYAGLTALSDDLLTREWKRDDGAGLTIERCLIDANWGASTDLVFQFCRQSSQSAIVMPSHGKYVGASSVPFSEYVPRMGDRVGLHWRIPT